MKLSLRKKAIGVVLLMALALTLAAGIISYRVYAGAMDSHYQMLTENVAQTAASVLDTAQVKKYVDAVKEIYLAAPGQEFDNEDDYNAYLATFDVVKDEGYEELFRMLEKIKLANGVVSLYISYMDPVSMTGVYVLDADRTETGCPAGVWDIIYPDNYEAMQHPEDGFDAYITDTEDYGWLCSAGVAVIGDDGEVICHVFVDISMDDVMQDRQDYIIRMGIVLLAVTLALVVIFILAVDRAVVKPINQLAKAAESFVDNKYDTTSTEVSAIEKLEIHTGDEVEHLFVAIKQMERDINEYIDNITAITAEKERIGAELSVATQIQSSMLPSIFPAFPERDEFDIYATMTLAKEVGGDFYDFFMVDEKHLAIVMADVSGKGVPAALFMVIGKTLIKDHTTPGIDLGMVFMEVNRLLCQANSEGLFITAFEGVLDLETGQFNFVNAGHELPFIKKVGRGYEPYKIRAGFVLAGMEGVKYRSGSIKLDPGDKLFQYTDGVTEATDANNELYGMERLEDCLNANADLDPTALLPAVKADIDKFVGEAPQFDDITMLCLEYRKPMDNSDRYEMTIEALVENIPAVTGFVNRRLEPLDIPQVTLDKIDIAVDEMFGNVAQFAYGKEGGSATIRVEVEENPTAVIITIKDKGKAFDPTSFVAPDITKPAEERHVGALGRYIVRETMDSVEYEYKNGQNILTFKKIIEE